MRQVDACRTTLASQYFLFRFTSFLSLEGVSFSPFFSETSPLKRGTSASGQPATIQTNSEPGYSLRIKRCNLMINRVGFSPSSAHQSIYVRCYFKGTFKVVPLSTCPLQLMTWVDITAYSQRTLKVPACRSRADTVTSVRINVFTYVFSMGYQRIVRLQTVAIKPTNCSGACLTLLTDILPGVCH